MRKVVRLAMFAALLGGSGNANAENNSSDTVRGKLIVTCAPKSGKYDGRYQYILAGRPIRQLSSDCSPGMGTSYIQIEQVFRSKSATTLLVVEGVSATSQTVRVLYIPARGPASLVDTLGGDGFALVRKAPAIFRLTAPGGGFALSDSRKSTWTCVIDINFETGRVSGDLAVPYEPGLPRSVCEAALTRVPL